MFDNLDYELNFNSYQIINNEKETLLDFIDKVLNNDKLLEEVWYGNWKLIYTRSNLVEMGAKKGNELK